MKKICLQCNKGFEKSYYRSKSSWSVAKYCSVECFRINTPLKGNQYRKGLPSPMKGKKHSLETIKQMSESKKGQIAWNKGIKCPWTTERNLRDNPKRKGENHWKWISDRTKIIPKQKRNDYAYKEWRKNVWLRDNWRCKIANPDCKGRIEAHHILGWTEYPELRYQVNNGITLCHTHHPRKRSEEAKLSPYFQKLVAEMK